MIYKNVAAAVGVIIVYNEKIVMTLRAKDPGKNSLDLPGGFVNKNENLEEAFSDLQKQSDIVLVEGVGGWEVPLNSEQTVADLALAFGLPVIMVVRLRLGCLNHAILSYKAIIQAGLICAGWIGNQIDPDVAFIEEYTQTLQQKIDAPMLGSLPYNPEFCPDMLVKHLNSSLFDQVE